VTQEADMSNAHTPGDPGAPAVVVHVNNQPVSIDGPRVTGLQIKQAAIAEGVAMGVDFVLSELRPNGRPDIVGNEDVVTVNKNSRFTATDDDDDS
jgi:hypothetical protein